MKIYSEIYLAGGCFWGTQHFLQLINGIVETEVGYANGSTKNPTYQEVKQQKTGHAETVKVVYNPDVASLSTILDLFFKTIDPTSLNKQGDDAGTQYRTGIYYVNESDLPIIHAEIDRLAKMYNAPIAVEVLPLNNFYSAEDYHQDYLNKNVEGYCHIDPSLFELAQKTNR